MKLHSIPPDTAQNASQDPTAEASRRLEIVSGPDGLRRLTPAWEELVARIEQPRFFHQPAWYRGYLESLAPEPDSTLFCAVWVEDQLEAIVPLTRIRRPGAVGLELPRHPHMPLADVVVARSEHLSEYLSLVLQGLARDRPEGWDFIRFAGILVHAPLYRTLAGGEYSSRLHYATGHCDYLEICPYDEMFRRTSSNYRSNLRRARKRLAELPDVHHTRSVAAADLARDFETFLELENSGWKGSQGTAIQVDDRLTEFYRNLTRDFGEDGNCEIHTLWSGSKPLAAEFLLRTSDTLYQLKLAYDEEFSQYAPGNLLLERILQQCHQRGDVRYLNLVSDAHWHTKLRPQRWEVATVLVYQDSLRGQMVRLAHQLRRRGHDFAMRRIRPIYRRLRGKGHQH
jgi:CelD/BcsL family acetyltransferase involved in cellulose biosynthesis